MDPIKITMVMSKACKNSMQFKAVGEEKGDFSNIYVRMDYYDRMGKPNKIIVSIEPAI